MQSISYPHLLVAIIPVFTTMAVGFGIRRSGKFRAEVDRDFMWLVVNILYPAIILHYIIGNPALQNRTNLVLPPLVAFGTVLLGFLVARIVVNRLAPKTDLNIQRTFSFTTGLYNYGFIPIPIILSLFPQEVESTLGVLFIHNVGVEMAFWSVGIIILTGTISRSSFRRVLNLPFITLCLGITLNLTGLEQSIPQFVLESLRMLSNCAIPMGLILAGATFADLITTQALGKIFTPIPLLSILTRLLILPLLFILIAKYLPGASIELRRIIVIQAAMPAAIFPLVVSKHYKGDTETAVHVIAATTFGSLCTIPIWIGLGMAWVF